MKSLQFQSTILAAVVTIPAFSNSLVWGDKAADQKVPQRVEKILRDRVTSPTNSLKLVLKPGARAAEGFFDEVVIEGQPVRIKKLRISEFSLHAKDVRINVPALADEKIRTMQAKTQLRAVVTEDDLTAMLAAGKTTGSMGLKVKYLKDPENGDVLQVAGNWAWTWFSGPIVGVGKLRVTADNKVYADIISLKLNGREVPGFVKNKFSEKLNPVLDYNDVPFQPRFRGVKVEGPRAILFA